MKPRSVLASASRRCAGSCRGNPSAFIASALACCSMRKSTFNPISHHASVKHRERKQNEMQLKNFTPADVLAHATGVLQAKPLTALASGNGFGAYCSTTRLLASVLCHRCRSVQPRRGSLSASIETEAGERVQHYLCAICCEELRREQG